MKMSVRKPTDAEITQTQNWGDWGRVPCTFTLFYDSKETCLILAGKATVTSTDGSQITFKAGDWVEFDEGLECTWTITETIQKKYQFD